MQSRPGMEVEIHVRGEVLAFQVFVCATADILGVVAQFPNAGEPGNESKKLRRPQHRVEAPIRRA